MVSCILLEYINTIDKHCSCQNRRLFAISFHLDYYRTPLAARELLINTCYASQFNNLKLPDLNPFFELFNNRELAIGTISIVLIGISLFSEKIRKAYLNVVSSFINPLIILPLTVYFIYIAYLAYFSSNYLPLDTSSFKTITLWTLFVGLSLIWKFAASKDVIELFFTVIKSSFAAIIVLEFVIDFYVFSFITELFLVAIISLVVFIEAGSSIKIEDKTVNNFSNTILSASGILLLIIVFYYIITDFMSLITFEHAISFILPSLLTIATLPFIFALLVTVQYEGVLRKFSRSNSSLYRKFSAFLYVLWQCHLNLNKLKNLNSSGAYYISRSLESENISKMYNEFRNLVKKDT